MTLGEKLRSLRAISGWTQPECAEKIGIEQSYLSKLENDKSVPSAEIFDGLCASYQVSADEMLKDLTTDYIKKNLLHLPIVAAKTHNKNDHIKLKRKFTVKICGALILIAITLFSISKLQMLSSNKLYEYKSHEINFTDVINKCMRKMEKKACLIKYIGDTETFAQLKKKLSKHSFLSSEYLGDSITKPLEIGYREYVATELFDKETLLNKILWLLSIILFAAGIIGLIIEARFYQIDKQ